MSVLRTRIIAVTAFFALCTAVARAQSSVPGSPLHPPGVYDRWLDEDVTYIITARERADFFKLNDDRARDAFIIAFWEKRNPNPGATENPFKEEHYRRIAFANEHFAGGSAPGWKTDQGKAYILLGPPDEIGNTSGYQHRPVQEWHSGIFTLIQ
ncbi:MAG TPA: GWxTD domain-containing protein [Candidatus Koribacter sp.]|jgi:GWxTD domain-containing protein